MLDGGYATRSELLSHLVQRTGRHASFFTISEERSIWTLLASQTTLFESSEDGVTLQVINSQVCVRAHPCLLAYWDA